ncbi:MAG: S24/S26 family peptidase [Oscillospiraceae bacterium]|nr:S24/S26 family peptidase [Oscillospiraceae bacterium]
MSNPVSYEEYLEQNGSMTYTNVGRSMLPLLRQGRDLFILMKKGPERCRVGDVVLYRAGEKYVLHRVVEVREDDYVILGDNCIRREFGISDEDIIGVMTGFVRGGKEHSVSDAGYRLYSAVWLRTEKPRVFLKRARAWLRRHL